MTNPVKSLLETTEFAAAVLREIEASGLLGKSSLAGKAIEAGSRLKASASLVSATAAIMATGYAPYHQDIIKNGGNWRHIIRGVAPHEFKPGVWVAEVNPGLRDAETLTNKLIATLNDTTG